MTHATDALEQIEIDAWRDCWAAAPARFAEAVGLETADLGGPLLAMCRRIDHYQFNRLIGGGLGDDEGRALDTAATRFREAGLANGYLQIAPGPRAAALAQRARGLGLRRLERVWTKFSRGAEPAAIPDSGLVVTVATPETAVAFGRAIAAGFGMPAALVPWLAALVARPGWHVYMACDGDRVVGGAAMYVAGPHAWLGIGAVQPEARRRGGQSALLARRVADGLACGVRLFATETGKPLAGEPHPSFSNIQRAGFVIAYERANWTV